VAYDATTDRFLVVWTGPNPAGSGFGVQAALVTCD
jgi:hypothetical protein